MDQDNESKRFMHKWLIDRGYVVLSATYRNTRGMFISMPWGWVMILVQDEWNEKHAFPCAPMPSTHMMLKLS